MAVIHISQEEAERDFASLLKRLDANTSFVIENGAKALATLKPTTDASLSSTIERLRKRSSVRMDAGFAEAVQNGIDSHREPLDLTVLE